jgi:hypothetical protein
MGATTLPFLDKGTTIVSGEAAALGAEEEEEEQDSAQSASASDRSVSRKRPSPGMQRLALANKI